MTSHTGYVMTLANSIIGVSLLAMPFCFKQCGLILGLLLLLTSNLTTRLACHLLVKSGVMCRRKSFEFVAYHAFGGTGKLLVELGVIGFLMGTSVAFFVVIGDLAPTIVEKILQIEHTNNLRTLVLLVTGVFVVLPLSLLRNIESLAAISTVTMIFYLMLVAKLFTESFSHLALADWTSRVNYWRPEGILQCFPIFAMALSCQTQVYEILEVLPNPTVERMNSVVREAVNLCTCLYVSVGFLGYVALAKEQFAGNILLSLSNSTSSDLFQFGFVLSIALSFPIVVFPCRASLNSLLFKKVSQYQELATHSSYIPDGWFKFLTFSIVGTALVTAILIPSIELVLGFVGSTIGVAICVIFPGAAFASISAKRTTERHVAQIMVGVGIAVMVLGVYGNLDAAVSSKIPDQPLPHLPPNLPPELSKSNLVKNDLKNEADGIGKSHDAVKTDIAKKPPLVPDQQIGNKKEPPLPMIVKIEEKIEVKQKDAQVLSDPMSADQRREPPVPAEPRVVNERKEPPLPSEPKTVDVQREPPLPAEPKMVEEKNEHVEGKQEKTPSTSESVSKVVKAGTQQKDVNIVIDNLNDKLEKPKSESADIKTKSELKNSSFVNVVPKKVEPIHNDAIAREELQLKEDDANRLPKKIEEVKENDLLQKLKEHQEEQKQLLKEQQSILEEIKIREGDIPPPAAPLNNAQPIQNEKFVDNIDKIQEVIDDLKGKKQEMDRVKEEKIAQEKKLMEDKKISSKLPEVNVNQVPLVGSKEKVIPSPIPYLVKKEESKQESVPKRDILGMPREKRDAGDAEETCDEVNTEKAASLKEDLEDNSVKIKESKILSAPLASIPTDIGVNNNKLVEGLIAQENSRRKKKK